MSGDHIQLDGDERDVFYVCLPNHPGRGVPGAVSNTIRLRDIFVDLERADLLELLSDADIVLDCGRDGKLIGLEIST